MEKGTEQEDPPVGGERRPRRTRTEVQGEPRGEQSWGPGDGGVTRGKEEEELRVGPKPTYPVLGTDLGHTPCTEVGEWGHENAPPGKRAVGLPCRGGVSGSGLQGSPAGPERRLEGK